MKVVEVTYDEKAKRKRRRERLQAFEGVCIARQGEGLNESFTVRKISYGEGVERVFPIYSPLVDSVSVVRKGKVRRAKLYYLRGRRGKSARIAERAEHAERRRAPRPDTAQSPERALFRANPWKMPKAPKIGHFLHSAHLRTPGNAVKSGLILIR